MPIREVCTPVLDALLELEASPTPEARSRLLESIRAARDALPEEDRRSGMCCPEDADRDYGSPEALEALLAAHEHVIVEGYYNHEGWGHHDSNEVIVLADGRVVAANCGGCSCGGTCHWDFVDSVELARRFIPEQVRDDG